MILQALYELALRERLLDDPDFEVHRIDVRITLSADGRPTAVSLLSEGKTVTTTTIPRLPLGRSGQSVKPGFFFDNAGYVLGLGPLPFQRSGAFIVLVEEVARTTNDAGARAVLAFLQSDPKCTVKSMFPDIVDWTPGLWVGFFFEGTFVHERPAVREAWQQRRLMPRDGPTTLCLVTGAQTQATRLHPFVRMPGTKGAALVSFNADSFESFDRTQGDNAPVCRAVSEGYVAALHWLLARRPDGRHRWGIHAGADVLLVWPKDAEDADSAQALLDVLDGKLAPATLDVRRPGTVYVALLGTNRTRIVVRAWLETSFGEVVDTILRYMKALGLDQGRTVPTPRELERAIGGGLPLSSALFSALVLAPLGLSAVPASLLLPALGRFIRGRDGARAATLQLAVIGILLHQRGIDIPMALDDTDTRLPYVCGRLFALMESLQYRAHGVRVNASLRETSFAGAMQYPMATFPRVLRLSAAHGHKALMRTGSTWHERQKDALFALLDGRPFPVQFSLEEQGVFALGYHHQREALFARSRTTNPKTDQSEA